MKHIDHTLNKAKIINTKHTYNKNNTIESIVILKVIEK